jgi:Holliday junction resolvase RusA-like endonuclease
MQKKGVLRNDKQVIGFTDRFVYGQGEGVEIEILEA